MRLISADDLDRIFNWHGLINCLREAFRGDTVAPLPHQHEIKVPGQPDATLLLTPAWREGLIAGVSIVNVFPGNPGRGLPVENGAYYLANANTGEPLAVIDGARLSQWRSAAASALAATYLARKDATEMLVLGTSSMAPFLIRAHCSIREFRRVRIWDRDIDEASRLAQTLDDIPSAVEAVAGIEAAVADADLVSWAIRANPPSIRGAWLSPGTHLDLVGGVSPDISESDDVVCRCTVFVDERDHEDGIAADLFDLCRGRHPGRRQSQEITLFKSSGTALEDLAAARLAFESSAS